MIQVSAPDLGEAEAAAVARILETGYLAMGEEVRAFERELEEFLGGGRRVACTGSCTAALHLALQALGIGPGDEVLAPSLTYAATFQGILASGARPVACDVRPEDGLLDLADAARRLGPRSRAVVPVHYAGYPGDWKRIYAFAEEHRLRVVEDAAHAFGSRYGGRRIGSIGDVVCFSFDPIKNITSGEGGAVVSDDDAVVSRVREARQLGIPCREDEIGLAEAQAGREEYEIREPGWRYQMPNIMAAIGRVQLSRFESELLPRRTMLARAYRERLSGIARVALLESDENVVPHLFPVRILGGARDAVRRSLAGRGYETAVHYKPNHLHPLFRTEHRLPVAERLYEELLSLPLHSGVTPRHIDEIAELIRTSPAA